jgi:hypothetical protein
MQLASSINRLKRVLPEYAPWRAMVWMERPGNREIELFRDPSPAPPRRGKGRSVYFDLFPLSGSERGGGEVEERVGCR